MKFLENLNIEIAKVTRGEIFDAEDDLKDGRDGVEIAGTLPEDLQKVWTFRARLVREIRSELEKIRLALPYINEQDAKSMKERFSALDCKIGRVDAFFWAAVREEFSLGGENIGLRSGWKIYHLTEKCKNCGARHTESDELVLNALIESIRNFFSANDNQTISSVVN